MNPWLALLVDFCIGFLIGSFPTSHLVARSKGVDLREQGSGNLGATNAFRVLGAGAALPVLLIDISKGVLAVWLGLRGILPAGPTGDASALAAGLGAILGHVFSPWVGFRGGKGVATGAGVFLTLAPWGAIPAFLVWAVLLGATRIMSVASIAGAVVLPIALILHTLENPGGPTRWATIALSLVVAGFVLWKHRDNMNRLRDGTEKPLWG